MKVKIKKLIENAVVPTYAHVGDVGMDFICTSVEYDKGKDLYILHTGLAFESDFNVAQFLFPRSSNRKTEAYLCNSVGIADSAIYRGEIMFCFKNRDSIETIATNRAIAAATETALIEENDSLKDFLERFKYVKEDTYKRAEKLEYSPYKAGDKIGQMVMMNYPTVEIEIVDELSETERGANGFGSTDLKK